MPYRGVLSQTGVASSDNESPKNGYVLGILGEVVACPEKVDPHLISSAHFVLMCSPSCSHLVVGSEVSSLWCLKERRS